MSFSLHVRYNNLKRSSLFWDVTQTRMVVSYRHFGITYRYHPQRSSRPFNMELIGCPETSVNNYQSTRRNIQEERRSHLFRGGSLQSRRSSRLLLL